MKKIYTFSLVAFGLALSAQATCADDSHSDPKSVLEIVDDLPSPTTQQMRAFQRGDIEELSKFIGASNTVVLASRYKSQWEIFDYQNSGKCVLHSYFRIVLSKDPAWKTGDVVVIVNYIEDFNSIPKLTIKKWENPSGELLYLFNLRMLQEFKNNVSPKCEVARTCSVLEKDKRNYQTLWATLKQKKCE